MQGWTEEEIRNRDLMAPCGLCCGACGVDIVTRDSNEKFKGIRRTSMGPSPKRQNVSAVCRLIRRRTATLGVMRARSETA